MLNIASEFLPEQKTRPDSAIKPEAHSPLHKFKLAEQARDQDESCGIWMNELPMLGYVVIRGNSTDAQFNHVIRDVLGVELPQKPPTFVSFRHGILIWQTPDEWLLVCARSKRDAYVSQLIKLTGSFHAQIVDNSGGLTMVMLSGAKQTTLLRHIGTYDFESILPGKAIGTVCHKVNIVVLRHDNEGLFLIFRRSFADFFWQLLTKSARPYGLGINRVKSHAFHPVLSLLEN